MILIVIAFKNSLCTFSFERKLFFKKKLWRRIIIDSDSLCLKLYHACGRKGERSTPLLIRSLPIYSEIFEYL